MHCGSKSSQIVRGDVYWKFLRQTQVRSRREGWKMAESKWLAFEDFVWSPLGQAVHQLSWVRNSSLTSLFIPLVLLLEVLLALQKQWGFASRSCLEDGQALSRAMNRWRSEWKFRLDRRKDTHGRVNWGRLERLEMYEWLFLVLQKEASAGAKLL